MMMTYSSRSRRLIGAATWGMGLVIALVWGGLDAGGVEGVGYGFAPPVEVAALETGRVLELPVALHDRVEAEEVVARMDPTPLEAEREMASANLLAVEQEQARTAMTEARRFAEGVETTLVDRARLAAELSEDQATLEALRERLALEEQLAATGASSSQAVEEWKRQMRVVEARMGANRRAVALASSAAEGAQARQGSLPTANDWAVVAASRELDWIETRIADYALRAGVNGEVSWVYRRPGDVVAAGDPILQVRPTSTSEIVAFVAPSEAIKLQAGDDASVRRATGQVIQGELVSVGAGPVVMPVQLWRMPSWPEYGVPIRVKVDVAVGPDEAVTVHL
jgi:multidrug resistance efflux pump